MFATADISAGTLLMREKPLVTVPSERLEGESLHAALARALLTSPEMERLIQDMEVVYPQRLSDVEDPILTAVRQQHAVDVERIAQCIARQASGESASTSQSAQGSVSVSEDEILRVLLCMRFNAFYSGFYVSMSMLNHSCLPNALKLAVPWGSDVVAVEDMKAGEEVFMSYLKPEQQSHARRCKLLQEQHFFEPGPSPLPPAMEALEVVVGSMQQGPQHAGTAADGGASPCGAPPDQQQGQGAACSPEQLEQLEEELDALEASTQEACALRDVGTLSSELLPSVSATSARASALLPPQHVTRLRARLAERAVRSELARLQQSEAEVAGGGKAAGSAGAGPDPSNLLQLLHVCADIHAVQTQCRGAGNLCHAGVLEDMHNVMEYMLGNDAKALFAAFPAWGNFGKASKASHGFKQALAKLKQLYTHAAGPL